MWRDPWTNGLANGYQLGEGLWAFNAGGWTGQGPHARRDAARAGGQDRSGARDPHRAARRARPRRVPARARARYVLGALHAAARVRTAERACCSPGGIRDPRARAVAGHPRRLAGLAAPPASSCRSCPPGAAAWPCSSPRRAWWRACGGRARPRHVGRARRAARGDPRRARRRGRCDRARRSSPGSRRPSATGPRSPRAASWRGCATAPWSTRQNPRLAAIAARLRRGAILDRSGAPLAESPAAGGPRRHPLGAALGTLLGTHPSRALLPDWALERRLEEAAARLPGAHRRPARSARRRRAAVAGSAPVRAAAGSGRRRA